MASTLEKYSQIKTTSTTSTRSFCPLILYHDKPSKQLSINLNENKHNNRTAIDRHRDKTNEMLEQNAQFWTEKSGLVDDYLDKEGIKVSPSTSTTSHISSSSSSSGESIATIDMMHGVHPVTTVMTAVRSPVIESTSMYGQRYFNNSIIEEEEDEKSYYPPLKVTNKPLSKQPTTADSSATKKRRRGNLPKEVTEFLRKWLIQHKKHPYPAEKEKADLARHTGLTVNQISNWFINARRRILQPMLESENLTAQMMAYPELSNNNSNPPNAYMEPPRRRRHDFYIYQRDFNSNIPDHHSSASPSPSPPTMHRHYHQAHDYYHPRYPYHPMEEDAPFHRRPSMMMIDSPVDYNGNQIPPMQ
ncbi:unnamed protein product [Mucor hiemalis]